MFNKVRNLGCVVEIVSSGGCSVSWYSNNYTLRPWPSVGLPFSGCFDATRVILKNEKWEMIET